MNLLDFSLLLLLLAPRLSAQVTPPLNEFTSGCSDSEQNGILEKTDRAYPYAVDLARSLTSKGIRVECVCASKHPGLFQGQVGAAWFRTDAGIFDSLYLPNGRVFRVEVVEKPENGCRIYSFRGTPKGRPMEDCGRPQVSIQHKNVMLLSGDQPLAERLEKVLNPPH